jgi:hypothetical protein
MADLGNIDAEIKKLTELKNSYGNLLDVEKTINNSLLYSVGIRKKYTNALTAAASAQKDLIAKEERLSGELKKSSKALAYSIKQHKVYKEQRKKLIQDQKKLITSGKKDTDAYKESRKELTKLRQAIRGNITSIEDFEKSVSAVVNQTKTLVGTGKKIKETFEKLSELDNKKISSAKELMDVTEARLDIMKKQIDIQEKAGTLDADEAKDLKAKLGQYEEMHKLVGEGLKSKVSEELAPMVDDLTKSATELTNKKRFEKDKHREIARSQGAAQARKRVSLRSEQISSLKTLFSTKASFGERMGAVKSHGEASKELGKLNEIMKDTSKGALGAGNMMKMLGTALNSLGKLGWIGLIISAVVTVAKAVNELDKFLKGFNKTFLQLQGPTVMMKDVKKSMKEFTDSIFDVKRNLKYGLKAEDILGMFKGISEAGMSLQGVMQNIAGGYKTLTLDAAKVQFDFGVSMDEAGAMLGEQVTDLKSTVDEASKSFKVLSYDASIAGIQSQKFYQATYAAAEALSYYGKFMDVASNNLKNFQKQGAMGFKDAQKQAQEMTNLFGNMGTTERLAFMEMSGGVESYRKDFQKMAAETGASIKEHNKALEEKRKKIEEEKSKGSKADQAVIANLENEVSAEEDLRSTLQKTFAMADHAAKSNALNMAGYLGMLSKDVGSKLSNYFKEMKKQGSIDIFADDEAAVNHMMNVMKVSEEFARKMIGNLQTSREGIKQMGNDVQKMVDNLPDTEKSAFKDKFAEIIKNGMEDGKMNMAAIKKGLLDYGKLNSTDVKQIMTYLDKYPQAVQELVKKGNKNLQENLETVTLTELNNVSKVNDDGMEAQDKRLDDLVNNTKSIEDFIGISAENAKYILSSNDIQKDAAMAAVSTAKTVGSIFSFLQATDKEKALLKDPSKDIYYKGLKEIGADIKVLEAGKAETSDVKKQEEYQKEIDRLSKNAAHLGDVLKKEHGADIGGQLIGSASDAALDKAKKIFEDKRAAEEAITQKRDEATSYRGKGDDKKARKLEKEADAMQKDFAYQKGYLQYSMKEVELFLYKKNKDTTKDDSKMTDTQNVTLNKDYKSSSGGYALLSKGDVVVNARNMSSGISGDLGAFAGTAAANMMSSLSPAKSQGAIAPSIPVNINIGSVSGNPEEFLKSIRPAIEQAFERMYFEKQKRR